MYHKKWKLVRVGGEGGGLGKPALGFVASPAEAVRGDEGRKTLRQQKPCRPERVRTPGESVTATAALPSLIPPAASGQGQAEPQEPSRIPEDFPFKSAECGDCHVEACCFLPAS